MPTLDVTHYLSMEQADDLIEVVKRFRLEPLDDEPVAEVDPVDAARRRVHALVDEMAARAHRHVKRAATEARLRLRGWMK